MLELCKFFARIRKSNTFYLIKRLIHLILTISVNKTTTKNHCKP